MSKSAELFEFKFHWLSEEGQATTMFARKGSFDGEFLILEETEIPVGIILQSIVQENRMVLAFFTGDEENPVGHLLIQTGVANDLKEQLDIARSDVWAKQHKEELVKKGLGHTYRDEECPVCTARLILTDMPETPQLFCHFCDSLTTIDQAEEPVSREEDYSLCEECGMFSKPQKFTIFYFYFLLVVYGWWSKTTRRCPPCMRGEAWKMLFGNLIFLLGVPVAIIQLIRCYGADTVSGKFKGLNAGNVHARAGDVAKALEMYREILERVPFSAGVKYNLGMALLMQGDDERAADTFELALEDCANYVPAYQQLQQLYPKMGEPEKLKELERIWSSGEDEEASDNDLEFIEEES